jgi:ferrous iron transport protein A
MTTTTDDVLKSLADMKVNERGTIVEIQGGEAFARRLEAIGMVPGKTVLKTSALSSKGPVTIEIDRARLALGYGMAERVLVRVNGSTR